MISGFINPFTGTWKSGLFSFTFKTDKSFSLEIGSGLSYKTEGTYEYNDTELTLIFSEENKTIFTYKFNDDKTELSIAPQSEFKWFKATINLNKQQN